MTKAYIIAILQGYYLTLGLLNLSFNALYEMRF